MTIPDYIKNAKSGDILSTKYGDVLMVARVEIVDNGLCIYYYFRYNKEDGLEMNEWLYGFYGPKFNEKESFYRPSSEEEKELLLSKIADSGFEMREVYDKMQPVRITQRIDVEKEITSFLGDDLWKTDVNWFGKDWLIGLAEHFIKLRPKLY